MKNGLLIILVLILSIGISFGQSNATDFNATDCDGNVHNLFTELDEGKIIVISWVMPCGPCASYALPAYYDVQSYSASHPGQILFYLADDFANTNCSSLTSWAATNSMTNCTVFSDDALDMTDYGIPGMPKTIVLGGSEHKVYFNKNENYQGIAAAIDQALADSSVGMAENTNVIQELNSFPNPANGVLNISYELSQPSELSLEVFNIIGSDVMTVKIQENKERGKHISQIDISGLTMGAYFLKLTTSVGSQMTRFTVFK